MSTRTETLEKGEKSKTFDSIEMKDVNSKKKKKKLQGSIKLRTASNAFYYWWHIPTRLMDMYL